MLEFWYRCFQFLFFKKASSAVGLFQPFEWQGVQMDQMRQEKEQSIIIVAGSVS